MCFSMRKTNIVRVVSGIIKSFIELKGDITLQNHTSLAKRIGGDLSSTYVIEKDCHLSFSPAKTFSEIRKLIDKGYYAIGLHVVSDKLICDGCSTSVKKADVYVKTNHDDTRNLCCMCTGIYEAIKKDIYEAIKKDI